MGAPRPQSPPPDPRQRPVLRLAAHGQRAEVLPGVIRLGLGLSVQHPPGDSQAERFRDHVEQVRLARAVGFDLVFASQHYLSHPFTYFQPFPTLGRIAAEADGMTIGTGILLLPLHQPLDVAEQVATLDVISGGRFIFGVGLGYRDAETEAMNLNPKERVSRYVEALEVVGRAGHLRGPTLSPEGRAHLAAHAPAPAPAHLDGGQRRRRRPPRGANGRRVVHESALDARHHRAPARALPR